MNVRIPHRNINGRWQAKVQQSVKIKFDIKPGALDEETKFPQDTVSDGRRTRVRHDHDRSRSRAGRTDGRTD